MEVAKVNFGETIGSGDCFWGTTLQEVRYVVEGYSAFDLSVTPTLPKIVELHFWKCYGGEVYEGYAIYNYLRGLANKGIVVKSYSHGLIASIAVLIYLAGDERYADHASEAFTHKPSCDLGVFPNADDMRTAAGELDKIQQQIAEVYVARAGVTLEQAHFYLNSNAWQTADEMVASGFATAKTTDVLVAPVGAEKVINYFKPQPPQNMALTAEEKTGFLTEIKNMVGDLFKSFKNEAEPTATTTVINLAVALSGEDAGSVYVDTEAADIAQGDLVYTDEAMTLTAADNTYTLADGRSISVVAGAIESITKAAEDTTATDLAAANNRITELEATNATLEAEKATAVANNAALNKTITNLQNKLKVVPGSTGNPNQPGLQVTNSKAAAAKPAAGGALSVRRS